MEHLNTPQSNDERAGLETVSAAKNEGACLCAQPVVDAGADATGGHWVGDGPNIRYVKE